MEKQGSAYERFKAEVYRIGWRVQYRAKKLRRREFPLYGIDTEPITNEDFTSFSENKVLIEQLIDTLPLHGKVIIYKLYIQDQTESEVARQLRISQQAVNKWKRKMIHQLSQTVNF